MKKRFGLLVAAVLWSGVAFAIDPFIITDIRVKGAERISPGTVFNYLPLKIGDRVDDVEASEAIRTLFKTGFFNDVELSREGTVLLVTVSERPSISSVTFSGNKDLSDEALTEGLQAAEITEGRIFNQSALDQAIDEIKNQYFNRGKYAADIEVDVVELERNRVDIALKFFEGETAKIKKINIAGNSAFDDEKLLDEFKLSTKGLFKFITKNDQYSKQKLSADMESLRNFYQDRGFLEFEINSTNVSISPDKKDVFINISVSEGERFTIGQLNVASGDEVSEEELSALITIAEGEPFSRTALGETRAALVNRLANEGYAFANVNAVPSISHEDNTVSFNFVVDPGRRIYVRRIEIEGNTNTRDEVIRRELRQLEGAWYSSESIKRSRIRLQRLGYFDEVTIETPSVAGSADQVDMRVTVKERSTGSFLFGVGFSDADGLLLQGSVSQRNLFGTGKELTIRADNSDVTDTIDFSYVNPYHTIDGVSRGFSITSRKVDASEAETAEYVVDSLGGGISYQIPLSEFDSFKWALQLETIDLEATAETPPEFDQFIQANPSNDNLRSTLTVARDTRNDFFFPTDGSLRRASLEFTIPSSDLEYYKATLFGSKYVPLSKKFTFKAGGELSYGDGYGDSEVLPFFKNYFAGGPQSVRGYDSRSLGPVDSGDTPETVGGNKRILLNAEILFPIPGDDDGKDKRVGFFVDGGMVFGDDEDADLGELRYSTGLALYWFTPVGPLSVSYGLPLNDESGDDLEKVQLSLGTVFR